MRITGFANISTAAIPEYELVAIDTLLGNDPRLPIDFHCIPVVGHPYGFLAHTRMVLNDDKPEAVSNALREVLSDAERAGCDWVLFDRDEPE